MALKQILPSLYRVPLRGVNAFLIDDAEDGLILVDTGTPKAPERILAACESWEGLPPTWATSW
jgi:glyoxylase-like metal-dependent hydrolase (beta-lactamase superfamily II)